LTYAVRLDVFEGPFDLLLQLIAARQVDVVDVDLADITADFLASVGDLADVDLETATHFLVVAATLVELKASRLLPTDDDDRLDELLADARDLLYARLLEYRGFREASRTLVALLEDGGRYSPRTAPLEFRFRGLLPDTRLGIDAVGLAGLAAGALAPRPAPRIDLSHVQAAFTSVRRAAQRLLSSLGGQGRRATFGDLTGGLSRPERVAWFLALLELYKLGHIGLDQPDVRAQLTIERLSAAADLAGIVDADVAEVDA